MYEKVTTAIRQHLANEYGEVAQEGSPISCVHAKLQVKSPTTVEISTVQNRLRDLFSYLDLEIGEQFESTTSNNELGWSFNLLNGKEHCMLTVRYRAQQLLTVQISHPPRVVSQ